MSSKTRSRHETKVVVIGGGLGGLSAAASLATDGFQVELFEKNEKLGGKLNLREVDGYRFDLGPSLIILPHLFRRIWERAGKAMDSYCELEPLEPQWRAFFEDGLVLDLHGELREMERELAKLGADARGYYAFLERSRRLYKFTEEHYLERGADTAWEILRGAKARDLRDLDLLSSMHETTKRELREPHLVQLFDFFIKYVGSSAYDSPALMSLLPYSQLGFGLYYVKGGMYNLALGLGRLLADLGARAHVNQEVTSIIREGREVRGVVLGDGTEVAADVVVSNMEVIPAYERLLGEQDGWLMRKYRYLFEPACSGLVVHLGVDKLYPELQHHNFVFSRDARQHWESVHHRKELPEDPTLYVVCPTKTNRALAPEGHEVIKILPHIPYVQPKPFTRQQYDALKERCYDKLERVGLRDLRQHIVVEDVLVPEDIERMYYSNHGAIYGVVCDRRRNFALKAPKRSERYANLFFVGGSVNPGGGTCMVVLSGQQVARMVRESYG